MFRSLKFYLLAALVLACGAAVLAQTICQVGNLADPVSPPVGGIVQGDQVFAYLIHPVDQCDCPEEFVQLQNLNMWLDFDASMVPANFTVRPGLRPAVFDLNLDQWVPDGYFYEGQPFDIIREGSGPLPACRCLRSTPAGSTSMTTSS